MRRVQGTSWARIMPSVRHKLNRTSRVSGCFDLSFVLLVRCSGSSGAKPVFLHQSPHVNLACESPMVKKVGQSPCWRKRGVVHLSATSPSPSPEIPPMPLQLCGMMSALDPIFRDSPPPGWNQSRSALQHPTGHVGVEMGASFLESCVVVGLQATLPLIPGLHDGLQGIEVIDIGGLRAYQFWPIWKMMLPFLRPRAGQAFGSLPGS
ncbi:hypothetical protein V8F06_007745 [Rhypophila decipiens]